MSTGTRPRPKGRLVVDPNNAYARLGVSPLSTTEEIKAFVLTKRSKAQASKRSRGDDDFGAAEAEMTRLQDLEEEIGTPRARAKYDAKHPQNELLTVQPARGDRRFELRERANLAAAWLVEELGPEGEFPSPESLPLWSPDVDAPLEQLLKRFERRPS
jgi:hypothetical protein